MNPILLKPNANGGSQVVLHGRVWRTLAARDYYAAFDVLSVGPRCLRRSVATVRVIVIEGAGSVGEMNLESTIW